jgi:GNAT superfamily N-acetyltransferase
MAFSLWQNIKYRCNYDRTIVHLQADLGHLPSPSAIDPFHTREMDMESADDLQLWVEIVNEAYDDGPYDLAAARKHIHEHLFLNISNIYFVVDGETPVGTISIGTYKANANVGGDAKIAVKKDYQGHGLGTYMILYGFGEMRKHGLRYAESIISIRRDTSIAIHFRCGFLPQYGRKYCQYKNQRRFFFIRMFVNLKLRRLYKHYRDKLSSHFLAGADTSASRIA